MCTMMRDARGSDGEGGSGVQPMLVKSGRGEGERNRGRTPGGDWGAPYGSPTIKQCNCGNPLPSHVPPGFSLLKPLETALTGGRPLFTQGVN